MQFLRLHAALPEDDGLAIARFHLTISDSLDFVDSDIHADRQPSRRHSEASAGYYRLHQQFGLGPVVAYSV
jgi:hypothetical protein